jgi:hypothetical protein
MIGPGGDKAARQDMFPTQVSEWQTETRVGSPPIGKGSSFDVRHPIAAHLKELAAARDAHPELATGATYVRYAKDAVLVTQRIDFASGKEAVVAFNNSNVRVKRGGIATGIPGDWTTVYGSGTFAGNAVDIPPLSAFVAVPSGAVPTEKIATPTVRARPDSLTSYYVLSASLNGGSATQAASVAFAIRRRGGAWQRIAVDDSLPYRSFLAPTRFRKHEQVEGVAVARGLDGTISVSQIASFVPNP